MSSKMSNIDKTLHCMCNLRNIYIILKHDYEVTIKTIKDITNLTFRKPYVSLICSVALKIIAYACSYLPSVLLAHSIFGVSLIFDLAIVVNIIKTAVKEIF